jgi:hypothetical protein
MESNFATEDFKLILEEKFLSKGLLWLYNAALQNCLELLPVTLLASCSYSIVTVLLVQSILTTQWYKNLFLSSKLVKNDRFLSLPTELHNTKYEALCQQAPTILHDLINHILHRALQQTISRDIDPVPCTLITSLVKAPYILVYNIYHAFPLVRALHFILKTFAERKGLIVVYRYSREFAVGSKGSAVKKRRHACVTRQ